MIYKKLIKPILIFILSLVTIFLLYLIGKNIYLANIDKKLKDATWIDKNVTISSSNINDDVYVVQKNNNITTYNMFYQKNITSKINNMLKTNNYSIEIY